MKSSRQCSRPTSPSCVPNACRHRWRALRTSCPVVPDLVVETASPTQSRQEMDGKAQQWLERGVPLVWVVWPARHEVDEWRQGDTSPRTLGTDDTLDGHEVVPGFRLPLADLFAEL